MLSRRNSDRSCNNMRGGQPNLLLSRLSECQTLHHSTHLTSIFIPGWERYKACWLWCLLDGSLGVRSLETGLKPYFFQSRECAVFDALFSDTLLVLEIYILLEIRRYLVWRPWAIIAPLFFFLKSTLPDPTALPARRTLPSISISLGHHELSERPN